MKKRFEYGCLTLMVGIALGCASQPPMTPKQPEPETFQPPLGELTVSPTPTPQPAIMESPSLPPDPSCGEVPCTMEPNCPPEVPVVPIVPMVPLPPVVTRIAYTGLFDYYPDYCYGSGRELFYYDDLVKDNYALPGAGSNIYNPEAYEGGNKIVFDRDGHIWSYDLYSQTNCLLDCIPGFATRPSITEDGCMMTFIGYPCGYLPPYGSDGGVAYLWVNGASCELAAVNATAACQGGVNWIRISANGIWVVFSTAAGGLYTYDPQNQMVCAVGNACDVGPAAMPDISPDGVHIAFTALSGGCGRPMIYLYNRVTDCIDMMPFANIALDALATFYPRFIDDCRLTFEAATPEDPSCKILEYNINLHLIRTLSILNMLR